MRCSKCNTENKDGSKFCIECGSKLEPESNVKYCPQCGVENKPSNNFCLNCGNRFCPTERIEQVHSDGKNKKGKNLHSAKRRANNNKSLNVIDEIKKHKFVSTAALALFGYLIMQLLPGEPKNESENYLNTLNRNTTPINQYGDPLVNDIASKFVCSCGTCGEEPLETCTCPTAKEERDFIKEQLDKGLKPDEIVIAVANKYGWLESEFANMYDVDKSKIWFGSNNQSGIDNYAGYNTLTGTTSQIATLTDRVTIISSFECPCGQCGIDKLIDCNCDHPKGAQEVKGFIDSKISEVKFTVSQIIEAVDSKYGGRIL